jgi:hypothetical protein
MRRTKGAFYHHFDDVGAFQAAMLVEWEALHTAGPISASSGGETAERRSALLRAAAVALDHRLERAIRAWGVHDRRAREAVRRVDARRIAYLAAIHRDRGRGDAPRLAELEYAVFLGAQALGVADDRRGAELGRTLRAAVEALQRPRA